MSAHKHKNTPLPFADRSPVVPLLAAIACLAALAFLYKNSVAGVFDIAIYKGIGERLTAILQGGTASLDSEYPPLASLLFFASFANPLHVSFDVAWLWSIVAMIALAGAYATFVLHDRFGWLIPASIVGTVFLISPELVFARFDVLVAVMLLLCLRARATGHFAQCAAFLAVACAIKVVPALLIPALFCTAPRTQWKRMALGFAAGLLVSFAVPVAVMGLQLTIGNIQHMLGYHSNREVQLESTWSGVHMLMKALVGQRAPVSLGHLSVNNNDLGPIFVTLSKFLIASVAVGAAGFALFKRRHAQVDTLSIGVLLFAVAASPVFSPQYIVWLLPLLLSWLVLRSGMICNRDVFWSVAALTALAGFTTQWVFPLNYMSVIDQEPLALFMLNVRNISIVLLALVLLRHALVPTKAKVHRRLEFVDALATLAVDCGMLLIAVLLLQAFRPNFLPILSDVRYTLTDGLHGSAPSTPFTLAQSTDDAKVTMTLQLAPALNDARFFLKPDDCITSLSMNGTAVAEAVFCGDGRVVDFAPYLKAGRNVLVANLQNKGGPLGLIVNPAHFGLLPFAMTSALFITLGMTLCGLWNAVRIWLALRAKYGHPSGIRADVREKAVLLLQLPLLEPLVAD